MDSDFYKVKVVHFINPYLIWVEVKDSSSKNHDDFYFEQIGVYGVLPLEIIMDPEEVTLMTKRCADWMPAATVLMKTVFAEATEVSFCPAFIDERNSIFDDNIHKYGEIIIKKPNGRYRLLSKLLLKSGFAVYDETLFESELASGKFKTKLNHNNTKDVVKELERKCKKQVKKQTMVFQTAEGLESALTVKNLEAHNKRNESKITRHVVQRKLEDLRMCKDVDVVALGRASTKKSSVSDTSSVLQKKTKLLRIKQMNTEDSAVKYFNRLRDKDLSVLNNSQTDDFEVKNKTVDLQIKSELEEKHVSNYVKDLNKQYKDQQQVGYDTEFSGRKHENMMEEDTEIKEFKVTQEKKRSRKKSKQMSSKIPEYNINSEVRVAYGPPDVEHAKLALKVLKKEVFVETFAAAKPEDVPDNPVEKTKEDIYGDVDSDTEDYIPKETKTVVKPQENIEIDSTSTTTKEETTEIAKQTHTTISVLKRKLRAHKEALTRKLVSSTTSDTSAKDSSTSVEEDIKQPVKYTPENLIQHVQVKNNVNPFKNIDPKISVFVDKLVTPVLMVHSKMNKRFQPAFKLRDVPFNSHIQIVLKNMSVQQPMMLQTLSWPAVLRGFSLFIVGPQRSGKTMGYLPAVCRLVSDQDTGIDSVGPMCIIVCATANSVSEIEATAKMFLGLNNKVLAFYAGMDERNMSMSLLNGCDLLICTPAILVRLLQTDFGVDLRRLTTFVLDDCERISEVYLNEIRIFFFKIKEMLKNRVVKELKVQYILASRVWCEFMEPLAKKVPDTVICIGAFQECVLYSKAQTTASFVTKENKINSVMEFLKQIDTSKRTVIVCRTDEEVDMLQKAVSEAKYPVFACNSTMTVQELYNLRVCWDDYQEPVIGPIMLCCDGNLSHMNITDAHHLLHYSLPHLFSTFCKRFSVVNDNYASIFREENETVKIKILLENDNVEQLPKILHFIKRCTSDIPQALNYICHKVLMEKDEMKAKKLVPICDSLMALGDCPDFWSCQERHVILKDYDEPKDWVPKDGVITFKIVHYHTAVLYSARLLTNTTNGNTVKYPQNYNMLAMKISMYFSRESNRKLLGIPEVGDVCAVSTSNNFFLRCQVVKILTYYQKGNPNYVLIRLIDEEKLEKARDVDLYYLPEEMSKTETHVVHVRLANVQPKDKDITFSNLAKHHLQQITDQDDDLYLRGQVCLTVGNCVFVDSLEACRDLSTMNKTVVRHDFKQELLEKHAISNPEHLLKLEKLRSDNGMLVKKSPEVTNTTIEQEAVTDQWASLEKDDMSIIFFASAQNPGLFFVRLVKYEEAYNILIKDIQKYVKQNLEKSTNAKIGDMVLAKLPDDGMYERARVDEITRGDRIKCFFVDQGDWIEVPKHHLLPITDKLINQLPFLAIECRLVGVKPAGQDWTEFATIWFTNCFEDNSGKLKQIYAKYCTKEQAQCTGGYKYGVVLIDTNTDVDTVLNDMIIEVNLAQEEETEIEYLNKVNFKQVETKIDDGKSEDEEERWEKLSKSSSRNSNFENIELQKPLDNIFAKKLIRSVPLVDSDAESETDDKWHINIDEDFMALLNPAQNIQNNKLEEINVPKLPAIKHSDSLSCSDANSPKKLSLQDSDSDSNVEKTSSASDIQMIPTPRIRELDSDDFTSPEPTQVSIHSPQIQLKECVIKNTTAEIDPLRKPRLCWWQNKKSVSIKILLIGVDKYNLTIGENKLKFDSIVNDTQYGFDLELYGIVNNKASSHSNKGQYILVNLVKILDRNWLTLTKSGGIMKWITYDVDALDVSSDEEEKNNILTDVIRNICEDDSESADDEFFDDLNYVYSK